MRARRAAGFGGVSGGALAGTGTVRGVLRALLLLVAATSFLYPLLTLLQASRCARRLPGFLASAASTGIFKTPTKRGGDSVSMLPRCTNGLHTSGVSGSWLDRACLRRCLRRCSRKP